MINKKLASERNISPEDIEEINKLHSYRDILEQDRKDGKIPRDEFLAIWTKNEYALQYLWGFPEDAKFHTFWRSPLCTCPKMDNEDALGTGYFVYIGDCPLHGWHA